VFVAGFRKKENQRIKCLTHRPGSLILVVGGRGMILFLAINGHTGETKFFKTYDQLLSFLEHKVLWKNGGTVSIERDTPECARIFG